MEPDTKVTVEDACRRLGVSRRTLYAYMARGLLSRIKAPGDRRSYVDALELEELRRDGTRMGHGAVRREEYLQLRAQVRRLQAVVDAVARMLDLQDVPLGMDATTLCEVHGRAAVALGAAEWSVEDLEAWAAVYHRLTEDDLEVIFSVAREPRPWDAFLRLCVAQCAYLSSRKDYQTATDLWTVHAALSEGRRRLRLSTMIYVERSGAATLPMADSGYSSTLAESIRSAVSAAKQAR